MLSRKHSDQSVESIGFSVELALWFPNLLCDQQCCTGPRRPRSNHSDNPRFRVRSPDPYMRETTSSHWKPRQTGQEIDGHFMFADRNFLPIVGSRQTTISLVVNLLGSKRIRVKLGRRPNRSVMMAPMPCSQVCSTTHIPFAMDCQMDVVFTPSTLVLT